MSRKRIVVVTGGGSGIGRATAKRFAEDGDFVVVADINEEGAKAVAGEIADTGGNAMHIAVDVADDSSVTALADAVENTHGPTDVLVTSAGVLQNVASIRNMDMDEHDRGWAVNYRGVYVQGHFTLAERPSKVGQNTLIGTLTASCALQERYQSA